jgi:hypothetical protein
VRDLREKSLNRKKQNKNYVSQSNLTISAWSRGSKSGRDVQS